MAVTQSADEVEEPAAATTTATTVALAVVARVALVRRPSGAGIVISSARVVAVAMGVACKQAVRAVVVGGPHGIAAVAIAAERQVRTGPPACKCMAGVACFGCWTRESGVVVRKARRAPMAGLVAEGTIVASTGVASSAPAVVHVPAIVVHVRPAKIAPVLPFVLVV